MRNAHLIAAVAVASSLSVLPLAANAAPSAEGDLFKSARGVAAQVSPGRNALPGKSRAVTVDRKQLGGARIRLNLGVGPDLEVVRERVVQNGKGRGWIGRVKGYEDSEVVLFESGAAVAGTIRHQGRLYKLMPGRNGTERLEEVSPGDPLPHPPMQMMPNIEPDVLGEGGTDVGATQQVGEGLSVVDLLVAYTPQTAAQNGGTDGINALIGLAVTETNQAYLNSGAPVQLRLVGGMQTSYQDSGDINADLMALTIPGDGALDDVLAMREQVGADIVSLLVEDAGYCGMSWQMGVLDPAYAAYAFNVVKTSCATGYYSFGHEVGHNLGLSHDHDNATSGLFPYSYGWQDPGAAFRTIMAYSCTLGCTRVQHFSNPEVSYAGLPTGALNYADNALALTDTAPVVATWRDSVVPFAPTAPTNLAAASVSHEQIDLSWTDEAMDEDGYTVERSLDAETWTQIADLGADSIGFSDAPLNPETAYYYRVSAYNGAGTSAPSNDAWATTDPAPVPAPAAPSGLAASALSHTEIALSWTDNAADETGYELERSTDGGAWELIASLAVDVDSHTDQGLDPSTSYDYRVRATGVGDPSEFSAIATASTDAEPVYPPADPSALGAEALSESEIALTWTDNADDETGYEVERSTDGGDNWILVATPPADTNAWTDTGLEPGTFYLYRVRALGSGGPSNYSNQAGATTNTPPATCSVSGADSLTLSDREMDWELTNSGDVAVTIDRIEISWPGEQGDLKKLYLDSAEIWRGSDAPAAADIDSGWNADASRRVLDADRSQVLKFKFGTRYKNDSQSDYSITVHFAEGCSVEF